MYIPEEFGKYLLLKKLAEDPLGETFRAGKVGKEGMEQVVLLRVFNGKGLDGRSTACGRTSHLSRRNIAPPPPASSPPKSATKTSRSIAASPPPGFR